MLDSRITCCPRAKLITRTVEGGGVGECGRDGMAGVGRSTLDPSTVLRVSGPSAPGKATGRSPLQGGDAAPIPFALKNGMHYPGRWNPAWGPEWRVGVERLAA